MRSVSHFLCCCQDCPPLADNLFCVLVGVAKRPWLSIQSAAFIVGWALPTKNSWWPVPGPLKTWPFWRQLASENNLAGFRNRIGRLGVSNLGHFNFKPLKESR